MFAFSMVISDTLAEYLLDTAAEIPLEEKGNRGSAQGMIEPEWAC
jgi:hypothetical protein